MAIIVLRHAKARASAGSGGDLDRVLDPVGIQQAKTVAQVIGHLAIDTSRLRVLVSPALRCQNTVAPLVSRFSVEPLVDKRLLEYASDSELLELVSLAHSASGTWVICGHGPSLLRLVRLLVREQGAMVADRELSLGVAAFLHLEFWAVSGRPLSLLARYAPPRYQGTVLIG